jgi:hypothetical protein
MLAGFALESHSIRLVNAATVSMMRCGTASSSPWTLLSPIICGAARNCVSNRLFLVSMTAVLFSTTSLLQFSSTVLLSDLRLGPLPGLLGNETVTYDFLTPGHDEPAGVPLIKRSYLRASGPTRSHHLPNILKRYQRLMGLVIRGCYYEQFFPFQIRNLETISETTPERRWCLTLELYVRGHIWTTSLGSSTGASLLSPVLSPAREIVRVF